MNKIFNYKMVELARDFRGMTQRQLSQKTNISQGQISKIELGIHSPTEDTINKLVKTLDFPISFFYQLNRQEYGLPLGIFDNKNGDFK